MKMRRFLISIMILTGLAASIMAAPVGARKDLNKDLPKISITSEQVKMYVNAMEAKVPNIRPRNASIVQYADENLKNQTEYCLLYLHGFSASPMEGYPTHLKLGKDLGMNLYVPRLADHGLDTPDALLKSTPENLWNSAKEALVLAKALGKKVILVGVSAGGVLALQMAADYPGDIAALILYAPCVKIATKGSWILSTPLGLQLGRMIMGGKYRVLPEDEKTNPYWNKKYRVEGTVYLQKLIDRTMKEKTFRAITQPVYTGYYYKDENHQDETVSVKSILWMFENLGTPADKKVAEAFPDAGSHVIACEFTNPNWMKVYQSTVAFLTKTFGLIPVKN